MADEFHPAVKLLLARMESNPEEFMGYSRWTTMLNTLREHGDKEEKAAINTLYKRLQLDDVHSKIMKELLCEPNEAVRTSRPAQLSASQLSDLQQVISNPNAQTAVNGPNSWPSLQNQASNINAYAKAVAMGLVNPYAPPPPLPAPLAGGIQNKPK